MKTALWYLKNYPSPMLIAPREDMHRQLSLSPGEVWNGADDREQVFIVTRGHLRIRRWDPSRGMVTVEVLNPGEMVGTLTTRAQPEYLEAAVAMQDCVGYVLDRREIDDRVSTWNLPAITFLRLEGWRLRRYTTWPGELMFRTLPTRLAFTLLMLAQQYPGDGRAEEQTLACSPQIRHLADLTGSSVALTQQVLDEWYLRGWLDRTQGHLTLKNVTRFYDHIQAMCSASPAAEDKENIDASHIRTRQNSSHQGHRSQAGLQRLLPDQP